MSCSSPPTARWRRAVAGSLSSSPTWAARTATRRVCSSVGAVALGQADHQGAHARAEVGLLGGDELRRREVADQGEGGAGAGDVPCRRDRDHGDRGELEPVAEVVAERHRADHELGEQRDAEPGAADGDEQVGRAARQPERARGAVGEQHAEAQAPGEQGVGGVGAGGRDLRDEGREREPRRGEREDERGERDLQDDSGSTSRGGEARGGRSGRAGRRRRGCRGRRRRRSRRSGRSGPPGSPGRAPPAARSWSRTRSRAASRGRRWRASPPGSGPRRRLRRCPRRRRRRRSAPPAAA